MTFQWVFKSPDDDAKDDPKPVTDKIKAMDTLYKNFTKLSYKDAGTYTCIVSNGYNEEDRYDIVLKVLRMYCLFLFVVITSTLYFKMVYFYEDFKK